MNQAYTWSVLNHTNKFENSLVGYHCPQCGKFYMIGSYTIQGIGNDTGEHFILCTKKQERCCNNNLPTPLVFKDHKDASAYLRNIVRNWKSIEIAKKGNIIEAHFKKEQSTYN